ncbi:hypothetical protein HOF92_06590 [bacterium]|jgi:hypothetical protein|nr:hypothetical protein [bacterium]
MEIVEKTIGIMDPNAFSFPQTLEQIIEHLNPEIEFGGQLHRVKTRRIMCRPYNTLLARTTCHAILNRGAHWNPYHNSFFQRVSHQAYLLNDMSSFFAINKNTSYGHMFELGLKIPKTFAIPQEDNSELEHSAKVSPDLVFTEYEMFNLREIGEEVGYPAYLKPQDGGGWIGVQKVESLEELVEAYKRSGPKPQNLQKSIEGYEEFVRCVGMGPQVIPMHYDPSAQYSHDRYMRSDDEPVESEFLVPEKKREVQQICKLINAFYGWDHNSCESLLMANGDIHPIDFANAYPDSSLVSLHYYFPELILCTVRWLLFTVCTNRKKKIFGHDWEDYFQVVEDSKLHGWNYQEKLRRYEELADRHFSTQEFHQFVEMSLGKEFEKKCWEFFASEEYAQILTEEVTRYFQLPMEQPRKIERYRSIHDLWLEENRISSGVPGIPDPVGI